MQWVELGDNAEIIINWMTSPPACILQDCENMNEEEEIGDMQEDSDSDNEA